MIAAAYCEVCPSDTADAFLVRDPHTGELVATVLRCKVCGHLSFA